MTDWSDQLACPQCVAVLGEPCLDLLGAGPQALPSRPRAVPHSGRKSREVASANRAARKAAPAKPRVAASSTSAGRRTARKQNTTAAAWLALAQRRSSHE